MNRAQFTQGGSQQITITNADIADGSIDYPTDGAGTLTFDKTSTLNTMRIVITGPDVRTAWNIDKIICGQENTSDTSSIQKIIFIEGNDTDEPEIEFLFDETIHQKAILINE